MSDKVAEIASLVSQDSEAAWVSNLWDTFNKQRASKIEEWLEVRDYVFATDTSSTTNNALPWKNSTTIPKLCQIRDNLHSNYLSSLFPNDNWLSWIGYSKEDSLKVKASTIEAYMRNKCREGHFRTEVSKALYDYIDYGNAFVTWDFEATHKEMPDGTIVPNFIGPRCRRISPLDVIFNPLARSFDDSFKIVRSVKTVGELRSKAATEPDNLFWEDALKRREQISRNMGGYSKEDFNKASGYSVDGFGNLYDYYQSGYVEILEFYGDFHNDLTGVLETNKVITVVDRSTVVRFEDIPSWRGKPNIVHVGWRSRQDNLWAMGPLDNLVGLQYRLDHLENLKADAMDLTVHPPLKIKGEVEEFEWGPSAEIHLDENGDVSEVTKSLNGIFMASSEIQQIEDRMELYAGAPREAMGIRTPGEKTLGEVNLLATAAGRIFQEKITNFEIELLEPLLNGMLEVSARNMDESDVIRVLDTDVGVEVFKSITKEDITANGNIRPVGARHFGKKSQDLQNLISVFNSPINSYIAPHTSGKALTRFVDDIVGLDGYKLFSDNIAIMEQRETQSLVNQAQEDLEVENAVPTEESVL